MDDDRPCKKRRLESEGLHSDDAVTIPKHAEPALDRATFEAFVGNTMPEDILSNLRLAAGNDLQTAVNLYLDGQWQAKSDHVVKPPSPIEEPDSHDRDPAASLPSLPSSQKAQTRSASLRSSMPHHRYIGAFGAEGWATCSGVGVLKYGDVVNIERQQPQQRHTRPASRGKTRGKRAAAGTAKTIAAPRGRIDVVVRFCTASGTEVGRLSNKTAAWMSTLMDLRMCKFEGRCVFAPPTLRTNDTVFLQIQCSLLKSAFFCESEELPGNKILPGASGIFGHQETEREFELRLRQVALVKLFEEINLLPTRQNAAAAKHQRRDLLEAAEKAGKAAKVNGEQQGETVSLSQSPASGKAGEKSSPPDCQAAEEAEDGEELEQNQLDELYRKAQSFDFNTPELEPADTFAMELRPYQKQSLHWMMAKETDDKSQQKEVSMHPLWEEYLWPTKDCDDQDLPVIEGLESFYVNPYSGDVQLEFPAQEQSCRGGILADEMGLGKTIQMLSLIHTHRPPKPAIAAQETKGSSKMLQQSDSNDPLMLAAHSTPRITLVVAPMSLLAQWQSETEAASREGTIRSLIYYGNERGVDLASPYSAPDVVITSYGTVLSEFQQMEKVNVAQKEENNGKSVSPSSGLFSVKFWRVVLDEAHLIKNRNSKTAKACYEIAADHRWVLSGTPIVNRLEDLFSLVRFLRVEPWSEFAFWRTFITVPFESKNYVRALDVVQTVLEPLVMRRTKDMKLPNGQPLVALPPKHVEVIPIELSKAERDVYDHIYRRVKQTFTNNLEAGTVMKSYTSLFAQILRLRQTCDHPILVRKPEVVADEVEALAAADEASGFADDMDLQSLIDQFSADTDVGQNNFGAHMLSQIRDEMEMECPVCAEEPMQNQTVTGCWHSACRDCLVTYIKRQQADGNQPRCFHCRQPINMRDLFEVVRQVDFGGGDSNDDDSDGHGNTANTREEEHSNQTKLAVTSAPKISLQRLGSANSSAKVMYLIDHLRQQQLETPGVKSVVFSQFTSFLTVLEGALQRAGIGYARLDGSLAQSARTAVLERFRRGRRTPVLLLSLRAGGVGLNLTCARTVYMMDPWWSFAVEAQAIDRVHRLGQTGAVVVRRLIVKDSVEERMLRVQERKKFIASSLGMMTQQERKLQSIQDIRELLGE